MPEIKCLRRNGKRERKSSGRPAAIVLMLRTKENSNLKKK